MCIVDEHRRAVAFAGEIEPALGAFELFERCEDRSRLPAGSDREARSGKCVLDLEGADQRQADRRLAARMGDAQYLCEAFDLRVQQADTVAALSDGENPQIARTRGRHHGFRCVMIGDDHGRTARNDQVGEQPQLGGQIGFERRMIVEMIAAEIGERAGRDPHAIEPALVEAVRRGFHRQMRHALARQFVERAMQRHRIGRGERAVDFVASAKPARSCRCSPPVCRARPRSGA